MKTSVLGFPRIGSNRELKKVTESYWKGEVTQEELKDIATSIRKKNWLKQYKLGIDLIPSNDFSFYDQVLDMSCLLGNIPSRFQTESQSDIDTSFFIARGFSKENTVGVLAGEMTKWFDTNYHYIVPEFSKETNFHLANSKPFDEYEEALQLGIKTKPVIIGPLTYLMIGKSIDKNFEPLDLLTELLEVYSQILSKYENLGAEWIQIDEPIFSLDLSYKQQELLKKAYQLLASKTNLKILLTSYFGEFQNNLDTYLSLPVAGFHLDTVRAYNEIDIFLEKFPQEKVLSLGLIDGRNIWKNDYQHSNQIIEKVQKYISNDNLIIATSCSLLHSPMSLENENNIDEEIKDWLAFANEKLVELVELKEISLGLGKDKLEKNKNSFIKKANSQKIHNIEVKKRLDAITPNDSRRQNSFEKRIKKQTKLLNLPLYPTTTIGSFPQTLEVRKMRADFNKGLINQEEYNFFLEKETSKAIKFQEDIELDVLVHGEFERNDMVEYFGKQLNGFVFSQFGWVQSYGSRCVKPPIIFGDITRPKPMTTKWFKYAQKQTKKPMKGMLTGPITILQWSFVRNDQPRSVTAKQIALAIRDEVKDLESIGALIIQVDEAAFREGLPLRKNDWQGYLTWASESFRLSTSVVKDETQIHTHMCYSEFNDIIEAIADLDADVISIETSRSNMELLNSFVNFKYPNQIGPGVYDIHSPRLPTKEEMKELIKKASLLISPEQIWVNPDCGLKTRDWQETKIALADMVDAAKLLRH